MKRLGWIGYTDNRPFFEETTDDYSDFGLSIPTVIVYKTKKEARKRFEDVRPVFVKG